jgi:hypothetical protein
MVQKKHEGFWWAKRAGVVAAALVLGVLIFGGYAAALPKPGGALPAAPKKEEAASQVYQHTYDEVFQASQEAIERMGLFLGDKDKDKGTLNGNGPYQEPGYTGTFKMIFDIHIETLSTKPETRLTINTQVKGMVARHELQSFNQRFLSEVQKVLATYH